MPGFLDFVSARWIKPLWDKLRVIRRDRNIELDKIANTFGDPNELSQLYIQPNCQHINPANEDEDGPISVVTSPVFVTLNKYLNGESPIRDDGRNHLFILSDAGMGKTSLLVMIRLMHLMAFWPKGYKCEILKLSSASIDEIKSIKHKRETVLLLDGLDEDPLAWGNIRKRINDLLKETINFKKTIISCRTQFFPNDEIDPFKRVGKIRIGNFICPMFYLSLFDEYQVAEYLNKKFPGTRNYDKRLKANDIVERMGSLRFRPLLLAYIDDFLESSIEKWSEYLVYKILIEAWLTRETRKLDAHGIHLEMPELLEACVILAGIMQFHATRELKQALFKQYVETHPVLTRIKSIDIGGRSLLNINSDGEYRFSHYTIQEFLLAYGVTHNTYANDSATFGGPLHSTNKIIDFLKESFLSTSELKMLRFNNVNFSNETIVELNFASTLITESDFSKSNINRCNFSGSEISNVNFKEANIVSTNFDNTVINACNLCNSYIEDVRLDCQNLTHTNITGATFLNVTFKECNFSLTDADCCKFINCVFESSLFRHVHMRAARFDRCIFSSCIMNYGSFDSCSFEGSNFLNTTLINTDFNRSNLTDSTFDQAIGTGASFYEATLTNVSYNQSINMDGISGEIRRTTRPHYVGS